MRQSEAKDLRSFLEEPVEEIVVAGVKARSTEPQQAMENAKVEAPFTSPLSAPLQEVGVKFISPWEGTDAHLQGTGVQFTTPWEGTGGQLHQVGARFTRPLGASPLRSTQMDTPPWGSPPLEKSLTEAKPRTTDDFTLQQTLPMVRATFTVPTPQPLRPYRLKRYQSRGVPVSPSRAISSGTRTLRPIDEKGWGEIAHLAPASQKIVQGEPSPAQKSWERRQHDIYAWLVLLLLFLLVVLGGIGLDSLIASYR